MNLSKQIGPLPLGMWLLVGVGGLGVAYMVNKSMAKSAVDAAEPSAGQLTESGVGTGGSQFLYDPPQTVTPDTPVENNDMWGRKVSDWLVAKGYPAINAQQAVRKYLSAQGLSAEERLMMNLAIGHFGAQPDPLPPTEDVPDTPTAPTAVAPNAPSGAKVNRATRRNNVVWWHDGKNITNFFVQATNRRTGNKTTASVGAYAVPGLPTVGNTYTYDHFLPPGAKSSDVYEYLIVAWNGNKMGGSVRTTASFLV